jgi:hypothetical protein
MAQLVVERTLKRLGYSTAFHVELTSATRGVKEQRRSSSKTIESDARSSRGPSCSASSASQGSTKNNRRTDLVLWSRPPSHFESSPRNDDSTPTLGAALTGGHPGAPSLIEDSLPRYPLKRPREDSPVSDLTSIASSAADDAGFDCIAGNPDGASLPSGEKKPSRCTLRKPRGQPRRASDRIAASENPSVHLGDSGIPGASVQVAHNHLPPLALAPSRLPGMYLGDAHSEALSKRRKDNTCQELASLSEATSRFTATAVPMVMADDAREVETGGISSRLNLARAAAHPGRLASLVNEENRYQAKAKRKHKHCDVSSTPENATAYLANISTREHSISRFGASGDVPPKRKRSGLPKGNLIPLPFNSSRNGRRTPSANRHSATGLAPSASTAASCLTPSNAHQSPRKTRERKEPSANAESPLLPQMDVSSHPQQAGCRSEYGSLRASPFSLPCRSNKPMTAKRDVAYPVVAGSTGTPRENGSSTRLAEIATTGGFLTASRLTAKRPSISLSYNSEDSRYARRSKHSFPPAGVPPVSEYAASFIGRTYPSVVSIPSPLRHPAELAEETGLQTPLTPSTSIFEQKRVKGLVLSVPSRKASERARMELPSPPTTPAKRVVMAEHRWPLGPKTPFPSSISPPMWAKVRNLVHLYGPNTHVQHIGPPRSMRNSALVSCVSKWGLLRK